MGKFIFWTLLTTIAAITLFLWQVHEVLTSFLIGLVLAYVFAPTVEKLSRGKLSRTVASILPIMAFYIFITVLLAWSVPTIIEQATSFTKSLPSMITELKTTFPQIDLVLTTALGMSMFEWAEHLDGNKLQIVSTVLEKITAGASSFFTLLSLVLITPLVTFYILNDWPNILTTVKEMIPPNHRKKTIDVMQRINYRVAGFIRGQMMVCLVQGVIYSTGFWLAGVPMGILLGIMTGTLSFIPAVGGILGILITLFIALLHFKLTVWIPYVAILGTFGVCSLLENFVLTPTLVGNKVGLHPIWIIFALMTGGQLAGIIGMLLAIPIAAIVAEVLPLITGLWKKTSAFKYTSSK